MPVDWDALVLAPCEAIFGEGNGGTVPQYTVKATGQTFALNGIFDEGYHGIDPELGTPLATSTPTMGIRLAALPTGIYPAQNDTCIILSTRFRMLRKYVVKNVEPDGHGAIRLQFNDAGAVS